MILFAHNVLKPFRIKLNLVSFSMINITTDLSAKEDSKAKVKKYVNEHFPEAVLM